MLQSISIRGRCFIVGDVHGCREQLDLQLAAWQFAPDAGDTLICVGDLADRGEESLACLALLEQAWCHCVLGNHELLMLKALLGGALQDLQLWLRNGGSWYQACSAQQQQWLHDLCMDRIRHLPLALEVTTRAGYHIGVVHADPLYAHWQQLRIMLLAPKPDSEQVERLLWQRQRLALLRQLPMTERERHPAAHIQGIDLVCMGHTPLPNDAPWQAGNLLWLDSGACMGNPLCLIEADDYLTKKPRNAGLME